MPSERILVALSGGVDSSVAALLLKQQGCTVVGAYMKNWINEDNVIGHCPWMQDIDDARTVAEKIGIEFRVVNLMQDYRRLVVDYLLDGYQRGLTPNPDVMCNRDMKFGMFAQYAKAESFSAVATGHYARRWSSISTSTTSGGVETAAHPQFSLLEGADKNKDQSYFLALLSQAQLRDARFPIGHLKKPELRRLAADAQLPTAQKKDSQGICFIGEVKMADFLKAYVVTGKRERDHALLVAFDGPEAPGLWTTECRVHSLSFIGDPVTTAQRLECRVRYRDPRVFCEFTPGPDNTASIKFESPQRALTSGQIMALYAGEKLLGGAVFA